MKGFKKCNNGHFYKEDLSICPYCPSGQNQGGGNDKTQINQGQGTEIDLGKTQVFGAGTQTIPVSNPGDQKTQVFGGFNSGASGGKDFNKTFIQGVTEDESGEQKVVARATRKLTGWLVSYTLDKMGVDYKIYEGQNTIGKDPKNSITISKDPSISGTHITILHKSGKFWASDEMSSNGSFLNNAELEIRKPYEMNDGDILKLGDTVFKFKSAL